MLRLKLIVYLCLFFAVANLGFFLYDGGWGHLVIGLIDAAVVVYGVTKLRLSDSPPPLSVAAMRSTEAAEYTCWHGRSGISCVKCSPRHVGSKDHK